MRHLQTSLFAAAASLLLSASAHAAAIDTFTVTPTGGGAVITFQLPVNPVVIVDGTIGDFQINGITTSAGLDNILFFSSADSGGLEVETAGSNIPLVNGYGPQMFTGTSSAPTLLTGNFTLLNPNTGAAIDNVVVAPLATTTVTPEPSSLILLGTGALGLLGAARRRFSL